MKQHTIKDDDRLSRRRAVRLFTARPVDLMFITACLVAGLLAVWSGQMMGFRMTPEGAVSTSRMLDELELPRQLPNNPVATESGEVYQLWDLLAANKTVLSVYAPWCPGCQKELPLLAEALSENGNLVVLVSHREDFADVRKQLDNLGLTDLTVYKDMTGNILQKGKVTKLPTTFLLKPYGKVLSRLIGFSKYKLRQLTKKAQAEE